MSVLFHQNNTVKAVCIYKQIFIDHPHLILLHNSRNVLVIELYFLHLRGWHAVSAVCNTVAAEIVIAGAVIKISAVCQKFFSVTVFFINGLINIIPDKSALIQWLCICQICVFVHGTTGISHGMRVFTTDKRFAPVFLQKCLDALHRRIHLAFHITGSVISAVPEYPLIVHQPCGVLFAVEL